MTRIAISPRFAMSTLRNKRAFLQVGAGKRTPYPTAVPDPVRTSNGREWRVQRFAEIDSTNRHLLDEARAGAPGDLVAVADHQTAGRGRFDRRWEAPPGSSLLVSVLLRPVPEGERAHRAVMAVALALADAVERVAGFRPALKWPNDLVVDERKLAGLLAQRDGDALVVGAGCNVQWESFPAELARNATACNMEAGHPVDRDALFSAFLECLAAGLDALDDVPARYRDRLATLDRHVRVERAHDAVVGLAVDVTDQGALVVRLDDGSEAVVTVGDVVHLR
jgi:BirA family biotin operon repressor/biotin-[acetyl-CoA-carboxylase] ligase